MDVIWFIISLFIFYSLVRLASYHGVLDAHKRIKRYADLEANNLKVCTACFAEVDTNLQECPKCNCKFKKKLKPKED
ncbi:MAG: hypothetical protein FWE33_03410 [Defluviitaleaceae bacterium]|nr:hypothetical protein [Defluviitaleaceae bacterium]